METESTERQKQQKHIVIICNVHAVEKSQIRVAGNQQVDSE